MSRRIEKLIGEDEGPSPTVRGLAAGGVVAMLVVFVTGPSVKGYSWATLLSVLAVLALGGAGVMARDALGRAWRRKGESGRPLAAAFVVLVLFSIGRLGIVVAAESAAAVRWSELEDALAAQGENPDQPLYTAWKRAPNDEMRLRIIGRLGEIGGTKPQWHLIDVIEDNGSSAEVRRAAATALGRIAKPIVRERLLQQLLLGDDTGRGAARLVLAAMVGSDLGDEPSVWFERFLDDDLAEGSPEALGRFLNALTKAPSAEVYMRKRSAFLRAARPEWRERIEAELGGDSASAFASDVRACAAEALGRLGDPRSIRALLSAFDRQKPDAKAAFVDALGALGGSDPFSREGTRVFEFLVERIEKEEDEALRKVYAAELQQMTGATVGVDAAAWRAWREDQILAADIAAGKMNRILPEASRAAQAADLPAFRRALDALVRVGTPHAVAQVRSFVLRRDLDARVRQMALDALVKAGGAFDREQLLGLLDREDDRRIAQAAIRGLAAHDDVRVIRALGERYQIEEDREVRRALVETLAKMTEDAALRALVPAVRDEAPEIAQLAQATLATRTGQDLGDDADAWTEWIAKYVK